MKSLYQLHVEFATRYPDEIMEGLESSMRGCYNVEISCYACGFLTGCICSLSNDILFELVNKLYPEKLL